MKYILEELKKEVPEFYQYEEFDNLLYVDFGRLGSYINKLTLELIDNKKKENIYLLKKIFTFLNKKFDLKNKEITNLIDVSIFESLVEIPYGYDIANTFMNKHMFDYFLEQYPYSEYKDVWDDKNYYSEEEYKRILNLPSTDEDE